MKGNRVTLSRLAITGTVTATTPSIVLTEIADAHSITYEENRLNEPRYLTDLINVINTKNVNIVKEPYDMGAYQYIARFVNKNYEWKRSSLNVAFNKLLEYTNLNKLMEVHIDFKYGPQTPENPENLNACVLYGLCKANRIDTRFDSTIDEMASNIKLLFLLRNNDVSHSVRSSIYDTIMYGGCDGFQLVNILTQIEPLRSSQLLNRYDNYSDNHNNDNNINNDNQDHDHNDHNNNNNHINHDQLVNSSIVIRNRNIRIHPHTHAEAIAMAAIYYKIDISDVSNPLAEYQELNRTPYFPLDRNLARRLQISNKYPSSIENPHLDQVFNLNLPAELYDEQDLLGMCSEEGYQNDDILHDGAYFTLQMAYLSETFLHGKQGTIINEENTWMEKIDDLEYDSIVVYGVRGGYLRAYAYAELADTFKMSKRFKRPDNEESFDDILIEKLYILCHKDQRIDESDECLRDRLELGTEIDRIKLYLKTNQAQVNDFLHRYDEYTEIEKKRVDKFFTTLLHAGMYMRGWNGEGPYPLASAQTTGHEEQGDIDIRVTRSIVDIERILQELNELNNLGDLMKQLPLMLYNTYSNEILPSTDEDEGLTIIERINIVKMGDDGSMKSCIRLSSNRFCATAHYYITLLGYPSPFDLANLAYIS